MQTWVCSQATPWADQTTRVLQRLANAGGSRLMQLKPSGQQYSFPVKVIIIALLLDYLATHNHRTILLVDISLYYYRSHKGGQT